ncbi:DinB family protein [Apibacter sp. HY039]|uniref:DinB family protein n=1 Tax=Apibacter sp. HY039 TaxID=2501476 RepID=UPI000FEBCB77|nr:DinB family protein [Apibacter sp. HY039]
MKKSDISPMPQYFDKYINLVKDIELLDAFESSLEDLYTLDTCLLEKIGNKTYLKDKWEIKEIIQHITDIERLLTSGVLRFSRNEPNFIISFDENRLTKNSKAKNKKLAYILEELISVRRSTICLYQSFDEEDLQKKELIGDMKSLY